MTMKMLAGTLVLVAVALAACGGNSEHGTPASQAPTKSPVATKSKTATQPSDGLTGYGATDAAWNAHHKMDTRPGMIVGAAYDVDPALAREGDSDSNARYYGVVHEGGRVDQYQMRFARGTTVAEARQSVLASEFPSDARIVRFRTLDSCAVMTVRSKRFKPSHGLLPTAAVEFVSGADGASYDPGDVWGAIISFGSFSEC
jgi:hypothetical protein